MTYPESLKVAVVKLLPPFLLIEAMMSVFKVGVPTFSSNTTILLTVGTLEEVKAFDMTVVDVALADGTQLSGCTFTDGLAGPEVKNNSGDLIYIENRRLITRAADQIEDIKLVIEF